MKKLLANKRGEGYINTAVIIIIAVVDGVRQFNSSYKNGGIYALNIHTTYDLHQ